MRNPTIITDLIKKEPYAEVRFKQYDSEQILNVKVLSNGQTYLLDNCTAVAYFKIPNKPLEQRNCVIVNNVITIKLDNYLLGYSGNVPFEIEIHKGSEVTTTFKLYYVVEESYDNNGAITTAPHWDVVNGLLNITPESYVTREEYESAMADVDSKLPVDLKLYPKKNELHEVATSGQYDDLEGKPVFLSEFVNDLPTVSGDGTMSPGSGYGVFINNDDITEIITAKAPNDVLKIDGEGLTKINLIPKTTEKGSKDIIRITSRFPTWKELMGDPLTMFNPKEFIFENNIIGINTANIGGGGSGGGLPFINVKSFKVWEKNPATGVLEEVSYGAKGDNTSPDMDTKAIKRAFQIAKDEGSVNIYIPDGNYILNETINVYRNTNVQASRNATIKKNHTNVMFANTLPTEAYIGYDGGKVGNTAIKNNGNIFFDGGTFDNDGTSGSTFSFINAQNFEFKNIIVKDILDSHAFDLCGISDMIIFNCNFLGFQYRRIGDLDSSGKVITDPASLKAYSECIQLDYSSAEGFPYQISGHDGTACQRIRVDKCVFSKSDRFPAWNRAYGGHNTYVPTYDWLHQTNGTPTGNTFNFLQCKPKDVYFLNSVVEGNGTLKYDYDQNDSQNFIIQQVRLQCVDNAIVMNNKFRNIKGGVSVDVDQTPKTMLADEMKKNFNLTGTATYAKSGVMPAKVTYIDKRGDMQTILFSASASDQDLTKITTHTHNGITYTIIWCKTTKFVDYYGWQNALVMNNEFTNVTCGIFNMKQATATIATSTVNNQIKVQDVVDVLGNTLIKVGTEIYYDTETNPRIVTAVVGTPSTDINGNVITISPYTLTIYPAFGVLPISGKAIYLKDSPSKNASTPIYVRGKSTPYDKITVTTNPDGTKKFSYTATSTTQPPRGKKCIIYANIIEGLEQKTVYSQYEDVIKNGRSVTKISAIDSTRTVLTLSSVTDSYMKAGENLYCDGNLSTPYQIMNVDAITKKVTIYPALVGTATTSSYMWSRKPILAGESGGASIINAIQGGYIHDLLIQKNIVRNVPRAIYISGSTRMNILGNHFFQINEVEAVCIDGGDYSNIIGNTFSDLNDQAVEMRNTNYFNIANNEFLNINKGLIYTSPYPEVIFTYNPLDTPTIIVMGNGSDGQYGSITGNMFVHNNANPIKVGIQAPETTKFIKMSNNSFPSPFVLQQDNKSDVGLDYGYRGNDADTLQGKSISTLGDIFITNERLGVAGGAASLDSTGKIPSTQLPITSGGSGFKSINLPNTKTINATTLANTLTLQGFGGITFDTKEGNTLVITYDDTLVQHIPAIDLAIDELNDNQVIITGDIDALKAWKLDLVNNVLVALNDKNTAQDNDITTLENRALTLENRALAIEQANTNQDTKIDNNTSHLSTIDATLNNNNTRITSVEAHRDDKTIHVTTTDKSNWNGKANATDVVTDYFKKTGTTKQTVSPDVDFSKNVTLSKYEEKIGTVTSGACDLSTGSIFNISVSATTTISLINPVFSTGYVQSIVIYLAMNGTFSVTFPASVKWHNDTLPSLVNGKTHEIVLRTNNDGVSWFATLGGTF